MNERKVYIQMSASGTTAGNLAWQWEFAEPVRLVYVKAAASNNSDATLAVADENGNTVVTAAVIGDTFSATELTPASNAVGMIAADVYIKFSLDYDGAGGTAADNPCINACFLVGEGA
jgi:hypothetical protein